MCQPWNLDVHPEHFPRTIHLLEVEGMLRWVSEEEAVQGIAIQGKWISDREFEETDGRIFVCPPPDAEGQREGEVTIKVR